MSETVENEEKVEQTEEERAYAHALAIGDIIEEIPEVKTEDVVEEETEIVDKEESKKVVQEEISIPKPRFDELAQENKALKERLALLEQSKPAVQQQQEANEVEVLEQKRDALQDRADELMLEGDLESRKAIIKEIRQIDRKIARTEVMSDVEARLYNQQISVTMENVVQNACSQYPFLDANSDSFDNDAVTVINSTQAAYMQQGYDAAKALQLAVQEKAPKFASLLNVATKTDKADEVRQTRDKAAKEKASNASINQPAPLPSKADKSTLDININTLSAAQIKAMPEEQRARLRGDA